MGERMKEKKRYQSSFEGDLVKYYDSFFLQDVRLHKEVEYIDQLIKKHGVRPCNYILDVGCGTGAHDELLGSKDYFVHGIDSSEDMIAYAEKEHAHRNVSHEVHNIQKWTSDCPYDACIALSHVIGYQLQNQDVEDMLININKALAENGLLIFNFYHLAGIISKGLSPQKKEICLKDGKILRFSNAKLNILQSNLELAYYYFIEDFFHDTSAEIEINEKMRCFTLNEIKLLLKYCGFNIIGIYEHMESEMIGETTWNGCVVCRKKM